MAASILYESGVFELGDVFYLACTLCNPPKHKYFVVAQTQPLRMLLINSEVNSFVLNKPRRHALHLSLLRSSHDFLQRDSYLACDHLSHEYSQVQLLGLLETDPSIRRGRIHDSVRPQIASAFANNHLIARKYLNELMPLWEAWLDGGSVEDPS